MTIDISYAETVTGWMAPSELTYLASLAEKSRCIAEIGSWQGRSTSALAAHTKGIVVCIDTWRGSVEHQPQLQGRPASGVFYAFRENVSRYDNIWPLLANSITGAGIISHSPIRFDMIFIDASHDYESVKADIEAWMPSRGNYCETHSASKFYEFQARRMNLRYKESATKKNVFCHTLNNTVIASPRVLIPILELYQNSDGSVTVPKVLQPYMGGQEQITKT